MQASNSTKEDGTKYFERLQIKGWRPEDEDFISKKAVKFYIRQKFDILDKVDRGTTVLDVGCGRGRLLLELAKKVEKPTYGLDINLNFLKNIKNKDEFQKAKINLVRGSAGYLPFKENAFDVSICVQVLTHISDKKSVLRELVRVSEKMLIIDMWIKGLRHTLLLGLRFALRHWIYYNIGVRLLNFTKISDRMSETDFTKLVTSTLLRNSDIYIYEKRMHGPWLTIFLKLKK